MTHVLGFGELTDLPKPLKPDRPTIDALLELLTTKIPETDRKAALKWQDVLLTLFEIFRRKPEIVKKEDLELVVRSAADNADWMFNDYYGLLHRAFDVVIGAHVSTYPRELREMMSEFGKLPIDTDREKAAFQRIRPFFH